MGQLNSRIPRPVKPANPPVTAPADWGDSTAPRLKISQNKKPAGKEPASPLLTHNQPPTTKVDSWCHGKVADIISHRIPKIAAPITAGASECGVPGTICRTIDKA